MGYVVDIAGCLGAWGASCLVRVGRGRGADVWGWGARLCEDEAGVDVWGGSWAGLMGNVLVLLGSCVVFEPAGWVG